MKVPIKPQQDGTHHVDHHIALHERVLEGKGLIVGRGIQVSTNENGQYVLEATTGKGGSDFKLSLYDIGTGCAKGEYYWVQASNPITTTGAVYPPTGLTALSVAGLWICIQDAPAGYFPVAPYPTPDDPTNANMYFLFLGNLHCV